MQWKMEFKQWILTNFDSCRVQLLLRTKHEESALQISTAEACQLNNSTAARLRPPFTPKSTYYWGSPGTVV
jgi:hypothetical protein